METMLPRILVVDDEPSLRRLYHRALAGRGFVVTEAPSGLAALDLVNEGFSVIVTDYGMPGMNGVEFIRAVRARGIQTPVLIVSGEFNADDVEGALPPGIVAVLRKPILIEEFLDAVFTASGIAPIAEAQHSPLPNG